MADEKKDDVNTEDSSVHERLDFIENGLKGTIERQDEVIEALKKEVKTLSQKRSSNNDDDDDDDGILIDRQSANVMSLPVVDGAPIIKGKIERVIGIPGLEYLMKVDVAEVLSEKDGVKEYKTYSFPLGCEIGRLDFSDKKLKGIETTAYENLKTKEFKLQDIDENDLTGASRVEKGKIIGEGGKIAEIDRSNGTPQFTGRHIRSVVRADIRHYTIEYNGKKFTLTNTELGNIRI